MKILVLSTHYAPDLGPGAALYTMLCEDLTALGHTVRVLTTVPHYPSGTVPREYRGKLFTLESRAGVDVDRVWVPSVKRSNLFARLCSFIIYQVLATWAGLFKRYDLLIANNPAIEVFLPYAILGVLRRKPIVFSVHDLYPDVGIKLGVFRHKSVITLVNALETYCYGHAAVVRVLSEGFRTALIKRGVPVTKLSLIWDWLDTSFIQPIERKNSFSTASNLDDCLTVMYAGNIGLSQGLETVLQAAEMLSDHRDIRFVFVGDGAERENLEAEARLRSLENVVFIPFQRRETLPAVLAAADISLISLKRGIGADSVPSKLYSILASARPVIAMVDGNSDTANLIKKAKCGIQIEPEDAESLSQAILKLYGDEAARRRLGSKGREFVTAFHSREIAARAFNEAITSCARA